MSPGAAPSELPPTGPRGLGPRAESGVVGAGTGTIIVAIASNLPNHFPHRSWLILLAPSISVGVSALWAWFRRRMADYLKEREINALFEQAEHRLKAIIDSPGESLQAKAQTQADLNEPHRLRTQLDLDRIRALMPKE